MKRLKRIIRMLSFLKDVNVMYIDIENDDQTVFVDRMLRADLPREGEVIIRNGKYWQIGTITHNMDGKIVEIDLYKY